MPVFSLQMVAMADGPGAGVEPRQEELWLRAFHAGESDCLEQCYRDHLDTIHRVVGAIVRDGADRETLVHEVFFRLLNEARLRQQFRGGSFVAWLRVVARNQAIDYARRRRLELRVSDAAADAAEDPAATQDVETQIDVRLTLQRFREQVLPQRWQRVFDARFVRQQDQLSAARSVGMSRTTLAYQEHRIRRLLRRFLLRGETR